MPVCIDRLAKMPLLGKPQPPQIEGDPAGAAMPEGVLPIYGTKVAASAAPRLEMPEGPMPAGVAKQLIMDVCLPCVVVKNRI